VRSVVILDQAIQARLEDRFIGCLVGGAVGDALGFTSENMSRKRIQAKYVRLTDYKVRPTWAYYTDDTQLSIAVAETLLANGGYNQPYFRRQLARWWLVFPRLSGRSTKNAALKCLLRLQNTGRDVPGSSGAMRAAPLALFYYDDREALFAKTVECCKVTHTHPSAIAGALVSVFSIAYCLTHTQLNRRAYLGELVDVLVNSELTPGLHRYYWDASGYASGIYLYKLSTRQGLTQTKKMILLK